MSRWWQGTWLVAERGLVETLRSRTFKVVTGLLLLVSVGVVAGPVLLGGEEEPYSLATVGAAPAPLSATLEAVAAAAEVEVEVEELPDEDAVRQAVRDGDVTAGLAGRTLYTGPHTDGTFPVVVAQAVVQVEIAQRLSDAGLDQGEIADVQSVQAPEQVTVGPVEDVDRAGIGYAVGIVLYLAITFAGSAISTTVAMEKGTRISEVLLAVLRPTQVMVGTVLAVGVVTLLQLALLVTPLAVAVQVTDSIGLPAVAGADLALALAWFLLGFTLYGFAFAASAALVDKVTEASSAVVPVMTVLIVGYVLGVVVVAPNPNSPWSVALSMFPLTAPMAMPIRWSAGEVPLYQLLLAMALTAAAAAVLAVLAAAVYRRAMLVTGRRARLRDVVAVRAGT